MASYDHTLRSTYGDFNEGKKFFLYAAGEDRGPYAIGSRWHIWKEFPKRKGRSWAQLLDEAEMTFEIIATATSSFRVYEGTKAVAKAVRQAWDSLSGTPWKEIERGALMRILGYQARYHGKVLRYHPVNDPVPGFPMEPKL